MIAASIDGAELKREKASCPMYDCCGVGDDGDRANNAMEAIARGRYYGIGDAYDRIFGGK